MRDGDQPVADFALGSLGTMAEIAPDPVTQEEDPGTDDALEAGFRRFDARTAWRVLVRNQARLLLDAVQEAEACRTLAAPQLQEAKLVRRSVARALSAAAYEARRRARVTDWLAGASIETAWTELHESSERLLTIQTPDQIKARIPEISAALESNLASKDSRLKPAQDALTKLQAGSAADVDSAREQIRGYLHTANSAGDAAHASVRSFRNLLIAVCAALIVALGMVSAVHVFDPTFLDLSGPYVKRGPDAVEVWQTVVVGALGGLLGAVWAISRLGSFSGTYRLPAYLALLRAPVGAATGLVAAIVIQSGLIDALKQQHGLTLLAYVVVFGYAPDVLLRFLDQKAAKVLGQAQSKDSPPHSSGGSSS